MLGRILVQFLAEYEVKERYDLRQRVDGNQEKALAALDKPLETWQEKPNRRSGAAAARRAARKRRGKR